MSPSVGRSTIHVEAFGNGTGLRVEGCIDETTPFAAHAEAPPPLRVDLGEVKYINSLGLREWIRFVRGATRRGPLTLARCSEAMVAQFNMVPDAAAGARVESFQAPYACDGCGREEPVLLQARDLPQGRASELPTLRCPECGEPFVFADLPERYLLFLG